MTLLEEYADKADEIRRDYDWRDCPITSHSMIKSMLADLINEVERRISIKLHREGSVGALVEMQITNVFSEMRGEK